MGEVTMDTLPMLTSQQSVLQSMGSQNEVTLYNGKFLAGVTPVLPASKFCLLKRCWAVFGSTDGTNASHNTQVDFRVGTLASSTLVATVTTNDPGSSYALGEILSKSLHFVIPRNKLLFVEVTRNGSGSTSMDDKQFAYGFDMHIAEASG